MFLRFILLSSFAIYSLPLKAMEHEERQGGVVLRAQPDQRIEFAFKREPLVAQLARNLGYLFRDDFDGNEEEFIGFLNSPNFVDDLWYDDKAREAFFRMSQLHLLRSDQVQREDEHSFYFSDLIKFFRIPGVKSPESNDHVVSILSELNRIISNLTAIRTQRFRKLPVHLQERILTQAIQIQSDSPTPEELARNLSFLFKYEFKGRSKRLQSFLRSKRFVEFLKQHSAYRKAFNTISIQRSVLMEARGDLRTISEEDEYPLFRFLTEQFAKDLPILQFTLRGSINKGLGLK